MKKSFILFATSLLVLAGCTRNQEIDIQESGLTLFASTESPADTKTVVESGVHVYWEPGDEIAVFMGEKSAKFTTDITAASGTATFKGTFGEEAWPDELDIWAVYPFAEDVVFDGETITTTLPSEQIAREGSFGKDMNLSIAHSNSSTLQFYNVGGGIRFSVTEEGIKKVMFEGLSGEIISGKVKIGFEDGLPVVKEVSSGSHFITLLPPSGKETFEKDTWYYIVAIPGALDCGYKLRFYKDTDYAKKVSEKKVEIKRSIFGSLENADSGIEYEAITPEYSMCSVNLSSLTNDYDKLVWNDPNHFILSRTNDDGSPSLDIIKCDQDTVIVCYYEENGLPSVISDGETYVFLGGYQGNTFRAVSINSEETSDVFEIDVDVNFDSYLALFENNTKIPTRADELSDKAKYEGYLARKGVLEACWNKFVNKGDFVPGGVNTHLFIMEALGYLISSDELWIEAVHSTFEWVGYTVIIGETVLTGTTGPVGLALTTFDVVVNKVLTPLIQGGFLLPDTDPRSPYMEELDYYYHHINTAVFQTMEHTFSWLGDSYDVELLSSGNFDVTASDWYIMEDYADWIFPSLYDKDGRVFLHVSVDNNATSGSQYRSDLLTVRWIDPQKLDTYAYFHVYQSSRPYTWPSTISFNDKTEARVFVYSEDEWEIYDKPSWCITKKVDHRILDIEKDSLVSNPEAGVITLVAKTKAGDFPFYLNVYPGEVLILGHWRVVENLYFEGGIITLADSGHAYLGIIDTNDENERLRWTQNGMSFHLEVDQRIGFIGYGYKWYNNVREYDGTINSDFTEISGTMYHNYRYYSWELDDGREHYYGGTFKLVKESF